MGISDVLRDVVAQRQAGINSLSPLQRSGARFTGGDDLQALEQLGQNELPIARSRFGGTERAIAGQADQVGLGERVQGARRRARSAADVAEGIFERQTRGRGLTQRQRRTAGRSLSLSRRLSEAGAGSAERRTSAGIARGAARAAGSIEDQIFAQEAAGLSNLANAQAQANIQRANEKAQKKADRNSLIGTGIGIGAAFLSSEDLKDKRGKPEGLLSKLEKIRVEKWNYKGEDEEHIGPYAEEFNDTFEVGQDNRHMISLVDAVGVLFGSVKELSERVSASG